MVRVDVLTALRLVAVLFTLFRWLACLNSVNFMPLYYSVHRAEDGDVCGPLQTSEKNYRISTQLVISCLYEVFCLALMF